MQSQTEQMEPQSIPYPEIPFVQELRNIKLVLAYDGTRFHGWQIQPQVLTIQGVLQDTLKTLCQEEIHVFGSGRTDAGVHARGQVAHFKTASKITVPDLQHALNDLLPDDIRVYDCREVDSTFHARHSARSKQYSYSILRRPINSPFRRCYVLHVPYILNVEGMSSAARCFLGEHDFTSFCDAQDESPSKVRTVYISEVHEEGRTQLIVFRVEANGFLHRMVRAMVGALLEVGRGRLAPDAIPTKLEARERISVPWTAPAQGLCLDWVKY
ncbi:MAG: tRNA pseudouridine(38-40) synthase TruA [Acidobacteriia bacterium]|nr:tRNA pseudouridine(38-40) synthase TruA [Terriglobia bacterium]